MKNKIIILTILTILSLGYCETLAASFTKNPVSIRSLALGNCSTTVIDSNSAFKNPATIQYYNKHSVSTLQGTLFNDINYLNLSYINPNVTSLNIGIGLNFLNTSVSEIKEATYDQTTGTAELTGDEIGYSGSAYTLSINKRFGKMSYGINFKYISEKIDDATGTGTGADLSFIYSLNPKVKLGLTMINIIKPNISWGENNYIADSQLLAGISYKLNEQFTFFGDLDKLEERDTVLHFGIEYSPYKFFAFRAGMDKNKITLGTGVDFESFEINYAYLDNGDSDLGTTQYFSASIIFNSVDNIADVEEELANEKALFKAIDEERLAQELQRVLTAEIEPLPITTDNEAIEELKPATTNENITTQNDIIEVTPIVDTSTSNEIVVTLEEPGEVKAPLFEYSLSLISARYYEDSHKTIIKVFVDNTGNQPDTISCSATLYDREQNIVNKFDPDKSKIIEGQTNVFYFNYTNIEQLDAGTYYIEAVTESKDSTTIQKEKFIIRNR